MITANKKEEIVQEIHRVVEEVKPSLRRNSKFG